MKNKEKKVPSNRSVSELILSAIYFLQKKNGVSAKDITKYICHKRGYKQSQMKSKVKEALDRGTKNGVFNLKKGLYKVGEECKKKLTTLKKKVKKKTEVNKLPKKIIRKKIPTEKAAAFEEKKLTPINESPNKSLVFRERVGSHKLSEDVFDRRARGNSYFEPSMLARASDEEYDEYDDEDDNEDDLNSETDEGQRGDIFTFTFVEDLSQDRFPELNICNAAKEVNQKSACSREKKKPRCSKKKGKKPKTSRTRKKKCSEAEEKRSKRCDDDYEEEGSKEDDEDEEGKGEDGGGEEETDHSAESEIEDVKGNKFGVRPKVKKSEKKEKTHLEQVRNKSKKEIKDIKEFKEQKDNKPNSKKKGEPEQGKKIKRYRKSKRESSNENVIEENQDSLLKSSEKSFSRSNCLITSSTKLFASDFKLSFPPNIMASDVKFSPANTKFESRDSSTLLFPQNLKGEPTEQLMNDEKLLDDLKVFCECEPPKRKNSSSSHGVSSTKDAEPTRKRIKSRRG